MKEKKFRRIINNPRHIAGVHSYCDRWCERCPLTLRCSVFALGQAMGEKCTNEGPGVAVWSRLEALRSSAAELLERHANHAGVAPTAKPRFGNHGRAVDSHRLGAAAKRYMEFAHRFVRETSDGLATMKAAAGSMVTPGEAFEIVAFYHLFITVKLSRALYRDELGEELENDPEPAGMPSDRDGSAKITLIAIDRSILAWAALTQQGTLMETALAAMVSLDRLRRGIEKEFPQARAFRRPGFDTLRFR